MKVMRLYCGCLGIKELKKSVKDDGDSQALFEKFKTKLADFKKRIAS